MKKLLLLGLVSVGFVGQNLYSYNQDDYKLVTTPNSNVYKNLPSDKVGWANNQYAQLNRANLQGASLIEAQLKGAHLNGANLQGAHLTLANLTGANLTGADLTGAHLEEAHLTSANLQGANLTGAYLEGADLQKANLEGANLTNVTCDSHIIFPSSSGYKCSNGEVVR